MEYILLMIAAILLLRKKNIVAPYEWWTTILTPIRKTIFTAGARPNTLTIYNGDKDGEITIYEIINGIDVITKIGPYETKVLFLAAGQQVDGATYPDNTEANIFYMAVITP